jgi:hypothetical protein
VGAADSSRRLFFWAPRIQHDIPRQPNFCVSVQTAHRYAITACRYDAVGGALATCDSSGAVQVRFARAEADDSGSDDEVVVAARVKRTQT